MNKQKPIAVVISEAKAKLANTVNQVAQESGLSPSVVVTILDCIRGQYMENVVLEMHALYRDVLEQDKGEE